MALDPFSVLSVAAAVVQFIDFSSQLVAKGYRLHGSMNGVLADNVDVETITTDLMEINLKLHSQGKLACNTKDEELLEDLCTRCAEIGGELLQYLEMLKVPRGTKHRKWKSFRQALKTVWTKKDLDALTAKLISFRCQMEFRILVSLKESSNHAVIQQSDHFGQLDKVAQHLSYSLAEDRALFKSELRFQSGIITRLHQEVKDHVIEQHEQTRVAIIQAIHQSQTYANISKSERLERSLESKQAEANRELLKSLSFPSMHERIDAIKEAHAKTFDWIFRQQSIRNSSWNSFSDWLEQGSGIYWISGKAGSGKSTLMRYIIRDARTRLRLENWAGNSVVIAGYFFWKSGVADQASLVGLYRSLLYDILFQKPHLIEKVFPEELSYFGSGSASSTVLASPPRWDLGCVTKALTILFQQDIGKACLFIDGLDEFDGEPLEAVNLFTNLITLNSDVKICLSSRPWAEFEDAFKGQPKLQVQDLTYDDIRVYVHDLLLGNPKMQGLCIKEPIEAPKLVREIVDKAQGVFLWVKLVVMSLLRGLVYNDNIKMLQYRVQDLPPEVEALYMYMLKRVEKVHHSEGSRIFQIMEAAYSENGKSDRTLCAVGLSHAEEYDDRRAIQCKWNPLNGAQVKALVKHVDNRLRICCAGLLDVSPSTEQSRRSNLVMMEELGNCVIEYTHRTAKDFLSTPEAAAFIARGTHHTPFNPSLQLLISNIVLLKTCTVSDMIIRPRSFISWTMNFAYSFERKVGHSNVELLDELDRAVSGHYSSIVHAVPSHDGTSMTRGSRLQRIIREKHWTNFIKLRDSYIYDPQDDFLSLTIRYDVYSYVSQKLENQDFSLHRKLGRPYLDYAIRPLAGDFFILSPKMISLLLRHGADPDQPSNDNILHGTAWSTPWSNAISLAYANHAKWQAAEALQHFEIFKLFLGRGASPNACFTVQDEDEGIERLIYVPEVIDVVFASFPDEKGRLKLLLAKLPAEPIYELPDVAARKGRKRLVGLKDWVRSPG